MKRLLGVILFAICGFQVVAASLAPLRVKGRHLVDPEGKCVRLIGPMQSMCPFFSSGRWGDGQDDAAIGRCLDYMQKICHALSDRSQGSYLNMIRLTDDGYWSHDDHLRKAAGKDSRPYTGCNWARYRRYVEKVLVPATERAVAEGLYVIIRPSYNTEGDTMVGDGYNHHLVREWETIASQPRLKALAGRVLFELENEPVNVKARNGEKEPDHRAVVDYMQPLVDTIRLQGWKGIILVPGAGYQSHFQGFMSQRIRDPLKNYGFAVHVYPGWYGQNDDSADTERFVAHFLNQVPVARDYPCVVTECDWSPEKPGAGKKNEFGEYIPANWGSWGTGSTSRWGNAYLEMLERLGNVSTLVGGLDIYFNVDTYLKTGRFEVGFKGNPECCSKAFQDLGKKWALEKKVTPEERDASWIKLMQGKEKPLTTVKALTEHFFRLSTSGWELHQPLKSDISHDFRFGPEMPVGRNSIYAALFRADRIEVEGKMYYRLRNYTNHGILRFANIEWGNGDSLCVTPDNGRLISGVSRERSKHLYGQDRPMDGLWEITEVRGGFTFKNVASGKYLGTHEKQLADQPTVWRCVTRVSEGEKKKTLEPETLSIRNPFIYADVPDVSLCSDSNYFYMVSTTMHLSPGAPVMRSRDMVHWEVVSYIYDSLDMKPEYSLTDPEKRVAYTAGQWATSLKYHQGKFYAYFIANGTGGFVFTADSAKGPWTMKRADFMHDADLLFDDDGSVYLFHGDGWLTKLKKDLTGRAEGWENHRILERREETALLEGTRCFKRGEYYYASMISGFLPNHRRRQVCYRSKSLDNTDWEKKVILETEFDDHGGVGQGDIIQGPDGKWYGVIFQDRGGVGRVPCLMPVTWIDDWPILGGPIGEIPNNDAKPYPNLRGMITSDDFSGETLDARWQWNHTPDKTAYSLNERKGWLRLKTVGTTDNLFMARNTLTQRMAGPESEAVARLDVSRMAEGDVAGLAAFMSESAVVKVVREKNGFKIQMTREKPFFDSKPEGKFYDRTEIEEYSVAELTTNKPIWLRVRGNFRANQDWAETAWSLDGRNWTWSKRRVPLRFDISRFFMGAKFAIFNYATKAGGGFVDVDKVAITMEEHERPSALFRTFKIETPQGVEVDNFSSANLNVNWTELGKASRRRWAEAGFNGKPCLRLDARPVSICEDENPSALLQNLPDGPFTATVSLAFRPQSREDFAGIALLNAAGIGCAIGLTETAEGQPCVSLVKFTRAGASTAVFTKMSKAGLIHLRVQSTEKDQIQFRWSLDGRKWMTLGRPIARQSLNRIGLYATSNALR